jgi:hypothetical protein
MVQTAARWEIAGEYFENCSCDVVCPCEISPQGLLQARPDQGFCNVYLVFHITEGRYGGVDLAGLNVALAVHTPGPMALGHWTVAAYLDARASAEQQLALGAIFSGAAGGPPAAVAPLIGTSLGAKVVPIDYRSEGKRRSARIGGILEAVVQAVPGADPEQAVVKQNVHPWFPALVQAFGVTSRYTDHGLEWDNTGKNADYASFRWTGP